MASNERNIRADVVSTPLLEYGINHIIMPPLVSATHDASGKSAEGDVVKHLYNWTNTYLKHLEESEKSLWKPIQKAFSTLKGIYEVAKSEHGSKLGKSLTSMNPGEFLFFFVRNQNSSILIRRLENGETLVEISEVSFPAEEVLKADSLLRSFPSRSICISKSHSQNHSFWNAFAKVICQLSEETPPWTIEKAKEETSQGNERTETTSSVLVMEYIFSILISLGRECPAKQGRTKVRDNCVWSQGKSPWRRSPFWIALCINLRRALMIVFKHDGDKQYKNFMLWVLCKFGDHALSSEASSEALSAINRKLCRRAIKMVGQRAFPFTIQETKRITGKISNQLAIIWDKIQSQNLTIALPPQEKAAESDMALKLSNSHQILDNIIKRDDMAVDTDRFVPETINPVFLVDGFPTISSPPSKKERIFLLAELEAWMQSSCQPWLLKQLASKEELAESCESLAELSKQYLELAKSEYTDCPREQSLAILVTVEIWIGIDRLCLELHEDFESYPIDPLSPSLLHTLLLPGSHEVTRLQRAESYLMDRIAGSSDQRPSFFSDPSPQSFAVAVFDRSDGMQQMRIKIEKLAQNKWNRKETEWTEKNTKYNQKKEVFENSVCQDDGPEGKKTHVTRCDKCMAEREMKKFKISPAEWLLPSDENQIKTWIFELDRPPGFDAWRDVLWSLVYDLGQAKASIPEKSTLRLPGYLGVSSKGNPRVTLGAKAKTQRSEQFPLGKSDVLVKNATQFQLYDEIGETFCVSKTGLTPDFGGICRFRLPEGPYFDLQWALESVHHLPNQIISNDKRGAAALSDLEYEAFCLVRAGERLQWMNLLRELSSTNLNWRDNSVRYLVLQTIWEAGTPPTEANNLRQSCAIFSENAFCRKLIEGLKGKTKAIKKNWNDHNTMATMVHITLRVLSLAPACFSHEAIELLQEQRQIASSWADELQTRLQDVTSEAERENIKNLVFQTASICIATYSVEDAHISESLKHGDDLELYITASIRSYETGPQSSAIASNDMAFLASRKTMATLRSEIRRAIVQFPAHLSAVIKDRLVGEALGPTWEFLGDNEWVVNETKGTKDASGATGRPKMVHYSLISGELLMDGAPLGRIPMEYEQNSLFQTLFGSRIVNVLLSGMPGMRYMVDHEIEGHRVHMDYRAAGLIVRATRGQETFEVVEPSIFRGDLPSHFYSSFVHWMNVRTGDIEFRPKDAVWEPSADNWTLQFRAEDSVFLRKGSQRLVETSSILAASIIEVLEAIEDSSAIHIIVSDDGAIEIELPRYPLHFFVNKNGAIESREYNAQVAYNQELGTLFGLKSKLILESSIHDGFTRNERSIIIPYGSAEVSKDHDHVQVYIIPTDPKQINHVRYVLDKQLGRLRGPLDALSKLYLAYLHAVCSFVKPDPATGLTGTEQALDLLRDASLFSTVCADENILNLLGRISKLTPRREFHHPDEKAIQRVASDSSLSQWSQHDGFAQTIEDLLAPLARMRAIYGQEKLPRTLEMTVLQYRSARHNSRFLAWDYGGSEILNSRVNHPEEVLKPSETRISRVRDIVGYVRVWPQQLPVVTDLSQRLREAGTVSGFVGDEISLEKTPISDIIKIRVRASWGALYNYCRKCKKKTDSYALMFFLGALAFAAKNDNEMDLVRTLLAFATNNQFSKLDPPGHMEYKLKEGCEFGKQGIREAIKRHTIPFAVTKNPPKRPKKTLQSEDQIKYESVVKEEVRKMTDELEKQWPSSAPEIREASKFPHINVEEAQAQCRVLFETWAQNQLLIKHLEEVHSLLEPMNRKKSKATRQKQTKRGSQAPAYSPFPFPKATKIPGLCDLIRKRTVNPVETAPAAILNVPVQGKSSLSSVKTDTNELGMIFRELESSRDRITRDLIKGLSISLQALKDTHSNFVGSIDIAKDLIRTHETDTQDLAQRVFTSLKESLSPKDEIEEIVEHAGMWPRVNIQSLLRLLSSRLSSTLPEAWRDATISLGECVSNSQRAQRLSLLESRGDSLALMKELENPGRQGWSPRDYPSWLLLEIENNFTIRELQAKVAINMMRPPSDENTVLQLNMGEGKSSVVIPMIACALPNGSNLLRVLVIKPLLQQAQSTLAQKLGGLVNRQVYLTPVSRASPDLDSKSLTQLRRIWEECMKKKGVLLALPEHILSFRQLGIERVSSDETLAIDLLEADDWLRLYSRDVLDESDEILDSRFQLVYTMGLQRQIDGGSTRLQSTQAVLAWVAQLCSEFSKKYPDKFEYEDLPQPGRFPIIRLTHGTAGDMLLEALVQDIIDQKVPGLGLGFTKAEDLQRLRCFIRMREMKKGNSKAVLETLRKLPAEHRVMVYLLRGLIAYKVLPFVLQRKRWAVEYGLTTRCLMAVPYKGKGVPSVASEYGHPDVANLLTCLSYYYDGLSVAQLRQAFETLLRKSNADDDFKLWCGDQTSSLGGINLDDEETFTSQIYPRFRYNTRTINFFLLDVVFPKEGKEFPSKLSVSSWDIPSLNKTNPTTGFSGTNDNRCLLPTHMRSEVMPELLHTNCLVLNALLQAKNRDYTCIATKDGKRLDVSSFLQLISSHSPAISVLIDVGAQVLEMDNVEVATTWLRHTELAKAVLYFSSEDEPMILERNGSIRRFATSPIRYKMEHCLIYLDEVHTRGVDLPIPDGSRAAVTLGPRLQKDRLVQACMRLRKLEQGGHSLKFFATPDVHRNIMETVGIGKDDGGSISSPEIIKWVILQTSQALGESLPLYITQGIEYARRSSLRTQLQLDQKRLRDNPHLLQNFLKEVQEPEARAMKDMYGLDREEHPFSAISDSKDPTIQRLQQIWEDADLSCTENAKISEEQERELNPEVEREREVQHAQQMEPHVHAVHPDVIYFVDTGLLPESRKLQTAFSSLISTSITRKAKGMVYFGLFPGLFASPDFVSTIVTKNEDDDAHEEEDDDDDDNDDKSEDGSPEARMYGVDEYLRTVRWVLSSTLTGNILLISEYEANECLLRIQKSKKARLHIYLPRITKSTADFSKLDFLTISGPLDEHIMHPTRENLIGLDLFAGNLYFRDFKHYETTVTFLGIATPAIRKESKRVKADGFVEVQNRKGKAAALAQSQFSTSPIAFLHTLLQVRSRGRSWVHTHMGYICSGKPLSEKNFSP